MNLKTRIKKLFYNFSQNTKHKRFEGTSIRKDFISIVIGSYQRKNLLKKTIESIRNNNIQFPLKLSL